MQLFPVTVIARHRRENLKKCSLKGLEGRSDLLFIPYPFETLPPLAGYIRLGFDGDLLSKADADKGIVLLDATWRYATRMERALHEIYPDLPVRSLPPYLTAYPRCQEGCAYPARGLASVEALYIAYTILERPTAGLLDHYFWKKAFLQQGE